MHGLCRLNPQLTLDRESKAVYNSNFDKSKVSLVAGGGSGGYIIRYLRIPDVLGHEPAHSAFVGEGMLNAAVPGTIFASPNTAQILRGIQLASSPLGTLVIVKSKRLYRKSMVISQTYQITLAMYFTSVSQRKNSPPRTQKLQELRVL